MTAASLAEALAALQTTLPRISKDQAAIIKSERGAYGYKYADLAAVSAALLPIMGRLGLSFSCCPTLDPASDHLVLAYTLRLAGTGEEISGQYPLPRNLSPQQTGSMITYARRYCLLAVTGAAPDDDDDDAQAAETAARARRNMPPEVNQDGAATFAEQTRMTHGPEPGATRHTATPADDPWYDVPAEDQPGSAAPHQKTAMFAQFTALGIRDRDTQIAFIEKVTGKRPASRNDLSWTDTSKVLEALAEKGRTG